MRRAAVAVSPGSGSMSMDTPASPAPLVRSVARTHTDVSKPGGTRSPYTATSRATSPSQRERGHCDHRGHDDRDLSGVRHRGESRLLAHHTSKSRDGFPPHVHRGDPRTEDAGLRDTGRRPERATTEDDRAHAGRVQDMDA